MIRSPSPSDQHELCDWAELLAATSGRRAITQGDLIKVIQPDDSQVDNPGADVDESSEDELIADDALSLAHKRARVLGQAYPFTLRGNVLRFNPERADSTGKCYLFHLLFAAASQSLITPTARHQFEVESQSALVGFFGGESFHFGWTKHNANIGNIQKRVEALCSKTTLGWKARQPVSLSAQKKDVGVDLLIWRQLSDRRANTLVLVGQCASGHNWPGKLSTSATQLLEDCLAETRDGPWVNCFCTPFHISDKVWRESARSHNGVIFDRIRLVLATGVSDRNRLGALSPGSRLWLSQTLASIESSMQVGRKGKKRLRHAKSRR